VVRHQTARVSAVMALVLAFAAIVVVLATTRSTYILHAEFPDAGQLVSGDLVTVAGHHVGSVGAITLTENGLADVQLNITDQSITPLRAGTIAQVGQLSLTGVANRFVGLTPGSGDPIASGGTLPPTQTRAIVDLDALLNALTPRVRLSLQRLLADGAYFVSQPTTAQLNSTWPYLNPAAAQISKLAGQVVADKLALDRLIGSAAQVSSALAARDADLRGAVSATAATFREVASERSALEDTLVRAPAVLAQATEVMGHVDSTLLTLNPVLLDLRPVAPRLADLLRAVVPAAGNAIPAIEGVQALVPGAIAVLHAFPAVERKATPAVRSLTGALTQVTPILAGFRPYAPDVIAGFFNGVGGAAGGSYDANGHYLKSLLTVQGTAGSLKGLLALLGTLSGPLGPFTGERTGLLAPCPGGGNPPATDRSNPWTNPDVLPKTGSICDPAHDQR
jgi:phospholipid/cholesterol/gamma-HCH transport system substrate-binding protein